MPALSCRMMPETEKKQTVLTVKELRIGDRIIEGVGIYDIVTVNKIVTSDDNGYGDVRILTLVDSQNVIYYRTYGISVEVTIQN